MSRKWTRTEEKNNLSFPLIEYKLSDEPCSVRCCFNTYDQGHTYKRSGWDVVCLKDDYYSISVERVAWFRHLRDAQHWVEMGTFFFKNSS
jgi:hypothetical protein